MPLTKFLESVCSTRRSLATEDGSNANAKTNLGTAPAPAPVSASISTSPGVPPRQQVGESSHAATNNYIRPEGQNVGNVSLLELVCFFLVFGYLILAFTRNVINGGFFLQFITDRPSSRVLAPPGGGSSISLA